MGIVGILIAAAVVVGAVFLYFWIMNRGKKCSCGEKYDATCIQDAKVIRTVNGAMGADMSDVEAVMKCKKCGKISHVKVTVKALQDEKYINRALEEHFNK